MALPSSSVPKIPIQTHNEYLIHYLKDALALSKDAVLSATLEKCLGMAQGLEDYLEEMSPQETPLQKKIFAETLAEPWETNFESGLTMFPFTLNMMNARHPSHFLKMITEIAKAERILEIGTFTGYSTAIFCDAKCVKSVTTLELDPYMVNFTKSRFAGTEEEKKLRTMQGPALESLEMLKKAGETFDLVFVDADKVNYINYYKFIMDNDLTGSNGVIVMDNTLWRAELYPEPHGDRGQVFADLNSYVHNDDRVTQVILQISDGVSLIRRK